MLRRTRKRLGDTLDGSTDGAAESFGNLLLLIRSDRSRVSGEGKDLVALGSKDILDESFAEKDVCKLGSVILACRPYFPTQIISNSRKSSRTNWTYRHPA